MIDLDLVLKSTGGRASGCPRGFSGVSIDSRTVGKGGLFFAVKGSSDGHDYAATAIEAGAGAAVVEDSSGLFETHPSMPLISVPSTVTALGDLACVWRKRAVNMTVVCVTGSSGKTTTKRALEAIAELSGLNFVASRKSFNNHLGLPLTLLEASAECRLCIAEVGINTPGEMDRLAEIASPNAGAITNIGTAHIGRFGNREKIADEKARLFSGLRTGGLLAVNLDDPLASAAVERIDCRKTSFSLSDRSADVCASDIKHDTGRMEFKLHLGGRELCVEVRASGEHNVMNFLCAAALTHSLGMEADLIARGISNFSPAEMRMETETVLQGVTLINDCYNANPDSVSAALLELCRVKKNSALGARAIAVLGDMLELGDMSAEYHRAAGREASDLGVDVVVCLGRMADSTLGGVSGAQSQKAVSHADAADIIRSVAKPGDTVLIKGSRAMEMEKITSGLREKGDDQA